MNNTQDSSIYKDYLTAEKEKFIQTYDFLEVYLDSLLDIKIMSLLIDYDKFHQFDKTYITENGLFKCTTSYIGRRIATSEKSIRNSLKRLESFQLIEVEIRMSIRYIRLNFDTLELIRAEYHNIDTEDLLYDEIKKKLQEVVGAELSSAHVRNFLPQGAELSSYNYNTNYNNNYNNICGDADEYDWIDEIDTNFEEDFRPFASIMDKQQ